ncbi:MAG: SpaH/EbpB family LPXTG-anchored major pilin [Micrococcales bacterium]|nr:SpaH/EbpB family LPXTG-anchored major pilin [Micrococcales bacterium]
MRKSRIAYRAGAAGVALGLSAFVAMAAAIPASADSTAPSTVVDPAQGGLSTTSITINKFQMPAGYGVTYNPTTDNGTAIDPSTLIDPSTGQAMKPIQDVTFTAQLVGGGTGSALDLTTSDGWQLANTLESGFVTANAGASNTDATNYVGGQYSLGTALKGQTDANGQVTFSSLPLGLYLIEETAAPAGTTPSAPFLVTVPMTDPVNLNAWMYAINVYPKNSQIGATKTVNDEAVAEPGQAVTWTVTADIPKDPTISAFQIMDPLDPRLNLDLSSVTADIKCAASDTPLNVGTDATSDATSDVAASTSTQPAGINASDLTNGNESYYDYSSTTQITTLTVNFNNSLTTLANNDTCQVVVTFQTTVAPGATTSDTNGAIPNQAIVYPNSASLAYLPGAPGQGPVAPGTGDNTNPTGNPDVSPIATKTPATYWGSVSFTKEALDGAHLPQGNVTFHVEYFIGPKADATATANWLPFNATDPSSATPTPYTSDSTTGVVTTPVLHYSNVIDTTDVASQNVIDETSNDYVNYRLVEDQASPGYELLPQPIQFWVTAPTGSLGNNDSTSIVYDAPHNAGFQLPLTGGSGTTAIYLAGVLVLAAGILLVVRNRRRSEAEQH